MPGAGKPTLCPYCRVPMRSAVMKCPACQVEIRSNFREVLFQFLSPEDLELLEQYLLANFSIKALEERTGMGYTALRSRIDRLIANYRRLLEGEDEKRRILDELAAGKITASEATERISRIPSAGYGRSD